MVQGLGLYEIIPVRAVYTIPISIYRHTVLTRVLTIKKSAYKYGARTWLVWDHSSKNSLYYPHQQILAHRSYHSPTSPNMKHGLNVLF